MIILIYILNVHVSSVFRKVMHSTGILKNTREAKRRRYRKEIM